MEDSLGRHRYSSIGRPGVGPRDRRPLRLDDKSGRPNRTTALDLTVEAGSYELPCFNALPVLLRAQPVEGLERRIFTGNGAAPQSALMSSDAR